MTLTLKDAQELADMTMKSAPKWVQEEVDQYLKEPNRQWDHLQTPMSAKPNPLKWFEIGDMVSVSPKTPWFKPRKSPRKMLPERLSRLLSRSRRCG